MHTLEYNKQIIEHMRKTKSVDIEKGLDYLLGDAIPKEHPDSVTKDAAIGMNRNNLFVRIPQEIADILGVDGKSRSHKNFRFMVRANADGTRSQSFEIVDKEVKSHGRR
jgi:hypothetical protein